ncbi:hypothetical protein KUL156_35050 [Alteromonas sp. KUL156]|nr:hypothetical protein BACT7_02070 [Tenacibaculum mesophilum]BFF38542.1 hypothetical protein BACY1_03470 [Tenacibaculum mesophilum]GFD80899.1 hypothetical protein KUL118_37610 [Tenacibaculum sp. KUL118]GFD92149.1 hypothetical protein KUL154_08820 [Alteromonas sp. KUL154]GFE00913.1 hypothetical protein KUL156_35050 [Alteromonas sp. KUL156]
MILAVRFDKIDHWAKKPTPSTASIEDAKTITSLKLIPKIIKEIKRANV